MRINNSIRNITIGLLSQIIIILLGFISRKVFLDNLGEELLGVNAFLTNILYLVSLIEAGIGTSIMYSLYTPLAQKNEEKVSNLINLYRKVYQAIALLTLIICVILVPFIKKVIIGNSNILLIYFLFVFNNIIHYFNAYKWSLITADQKGYLITKNNMYFRVFTLLVKMIILILTKNYILFLVADSLIFIIQNTVNTTIVEKEYPYICKKNTFRIDESDKKEITINIKALLLHNISEYLISGVDTILISVFIGVKKIGLYSNYTMIIEQLTALINSILAGVEQSIGNLIADEKNKGKNTEKTYQIFKILFFVNFCIYSLASLILFIILQDFVQWWLGREYLLSNFIIYCIILNFYLKGLKATILIFKNKSGLFKEDKFIVFIEALINLIISYFLVNKIGLSGVLIGTIISYLVISFWNQPRIVYKYLFKKQVYDYFKIYIFYFIVTLTSIIINSSIINHLFFTESISFWIFLLKCIIILIFHSSLIFIIFYKSYELSFLIQIIKKILFKKEIL